MDLGTFGLDNLSESIAKLPLGQNGITAKLSCDLQGCDVGVRSESNYPGHGRSALPQSPDN